MNRLAVWVCVYAEHPDDIDFVYWSSAHIWCTFDHWAPIYSTPIPNNVGIYMRILFVCTVLRCPRDHYIEPSPKFRAQSVGLRCGGTAVRFLGRSWKFTIKSPEVVDASLVLLKKRRPTSVVHDYARISKLLSSRIRIYASVALECGTAPKKAMRYYITAKAGWE